MTWRPRNFAYKALHYTLAHKAVLLILLFLITVLIRIPNVNQEYYSVDSAVIYIDIGQNINEGNGWKQDFRYVYTSETQEDDRIAHQTTCTPLYPLFLAGVFLFDDSLATIIFVNILLTGLLVVLVYLFGDRLFGQEVGLISAGVVMLNPTLYTLSVYVWSEPLFCVLLISAFYFMLFAKSNWYFVPAGIFAGLAYLARYNAVVAIAAVLMLLLWRKKYLSGFIFGASAFITALPWFIRNYVVFSNPLYSPLNTLKFSDASGWQNNYPSPPTGFQYPFTEFLRDSVAGFMSNARASCDVDLFFILLPFVIVGGILYLKNKNHQPLILFSLLSFIILSIGKGTTAWRARHLIPILLVLTPIGIATMSASVRHLMNAKFGMKQKIVTHKKVVMVLLIFLLVMYGLHDVWLTEQILKGGDPVRQETFVQEKNAYNWLSEHASSDDKIATTSPWDVHYFTDLGATLIPDVEESVMAGFIDRFNIAYFVINLPSYFAGGYSSNLFKELYQGNEQITVEDKVLSLVYSNDAVLIYQVG